MKRSASPDSAARKRSELPEPTGDYDWIELLKWMHGKDDDYWFCTIPMDVVNLVGELCGHKRTPEQNLLYEMARLLFQSPHPEIKLKAITTDVLNGEMLMQMGALPFVIDAICTGKGSSRLINHVHTFACEPRYHLALIDAGLCRLLLHYLRHAGCARLPEWLLDDLNSAGFFENSSINLTSLFNDDLNKTIVAHCQKTSTPSFVGSVSYMIDQNAIRVSAAECQKIRDDCFVACGDFTCAGSIRSAAFITETCYTKFGIPPDATHVDRLIVALKVLLLDNTQVEDFDKNAIVNAITMLAKIPCAAHKMLSDPILIDRYVRLHEKIANGNCYEHVLSNMFLTCARAKLPVDYESLRGYLTNLIDCRPVTCSQWVQETLQSPFAAQTMHLLAHPSVLDVVRAGLGDPTATDRQKLAFRQIAAAIGEYAQGIVKWAEVALPPSDCK